MQNIFTRIVSETIQLQSGDVKSLQFSRPMCLEVGSGRVWVTIEGGRTDYWLSAGQRLDIPGRGLVVIESVGAASKVQVKLCRNHWMARLACGASVLAKRLRGCRIDAGALRRG